MGDPVDLSEEREWVEFEAPIEVLPWGRNVYVVLRLDGTLEDAARAARTRRVDGRHPPSGAACSNHWTKQRERRRASGA